MKQTVTISGRGIVIALVGVALVLMLSVVVFRDRIRPPLKPPAPPPPEATAPVN
jgi:hypothetical protein